ncbi:hypothetical protein [Leptothrix discophora]|uniref:Uncharacterized protein n=1 Tax=Leptothrix discophora TaxID=89 RepID=A0ABT9G0Y6_LEPDI|nr:hypothetical protein [Leptothrix discophora]MDP4300056.1 hypothetical protein [Leptothrix discophora]
MALAAASLPAPAAAQAGVTRQQASRAAWRFGSLALMSLLTHRLHQRGLARIDLCLAAPAQAVRRHEMSQAWSRLHEVSLGRADRILSIAFYERVPVVKGGGDGSGSLDEQGWRDIVALRPQLPMLAYLAGRQELLAQPAGNCEAELARIASGEDSMDRQLARRDAGYPDLMALDLDHPERLGDPERRGIDR